MSTQEKIDAMDTKKNEEKAVAKKENFFTKTVNKVKNSDWKKVGLTALKVFEGVALLGGGFYLGSKYGRKEAGLIEGEGTVEETEEPTDDFELEELKKMEEEA